VRNKQNLEVKDPAERAQRIQMLQSTCSDPVKAREYLLNSSMINSIRRVATIQ
jgi:3-(3-hydroxy-phenyl)propionate hydroxylase